MIRGVFIKVSLADLIALAAPATDARADMQLPKPGKTNADATTLREFEGLYAEIEAALMAEDIDRLMSCYAEDYLHHGITKKQFRFMWLEIFSEFSELYSVHIFSKIDVYGDDAILICTRCSERSGGAVQVQGKKESFHVPFQQSGTGDHCVPGGS